MDCRRHVLVNVSRILASIQLITVGNQYTQVAPCVHEPDVLFGGAGEG